MSRRKALISPAVLVVLAAGYWYWAWDPTQIAGYVPGNAPLVLSVRGLYSGLDRAGYVDLVSGLPAPFRQRAMLPYSPIAPGLDLMDIVGSECVVFVPEGGLDDLSRSAVIAARVSQKAKLGEILGSLVGKGQKVPSPTGKRIRMAQMNEPARTVYYTRRDRILVASPSGRSIDAALQDRVVPDAPPLEESATFSLSVTGEGLAAVVELAKKKNLLPDGRIVKKVLDNMQSIEHASVDAFLDEHITLKGSLNLDIARQFALGVFRKEYKPFSPVSYGWVPKDCELWVSTNCPMVAEEVRMDLPHFDRLSAVILERFRLPTRLLMKEKAFSGEIMIARALIGGERAGFFVLATRKLIFPQKVVVELVERLGRKVGETSYMGDLNDDPFYRVSSRKTGDEGFVWFSKNAIAVTSSEGALDVMAARMQAAAEGSPFSEKGDVFVVADVLPDVLSPVRVRCVLDEGAIAFSGRFGLAVPEGR